MKKLFFLFTMLASVVASAQRTIPVTITNTEVDYSTKVVTFDLSWKGNDATHRDEVWVFVDIQPVTGVNTLGSWSPATLIPSAATVTAGSGNQYSSLTHTVVSGNTRGIWVNGTATNTTSAFAATVKVTLHSGTPARFNACAYATDYPPNANITSGSYSNGTYTLKGTTPFVINGSISIDDYTYSGGNITAITDATQCPGYRCGLKDEPASPVGCCAGLTEYNGYCRDLSALNFEVYPTEIGPMLYANRNQCPAGWRLPTTTELKQMWNYNAELNLCYASGNYLWAAGAGTIDQSCNCSTNTQYYLCCHLGCGCSNTPSLPAGSTSASGCCGTCNAYIRCVRNK
ncbi:MAG: hypothetical protein LBG31_04105 [Prevotellaceae bacterium]|jgi:hypothetical protein|nr:hypothetical protein [Prevotellaceae bacterium]